MIYILQKDLPNKKAGTRFIYAPNTGGYYYAEDDGDTGFKADDVEGNKEWFAPETVTPLQTSCSEMEFIEFLKRRFNITKDDAYTIGLFMAQIEKGWKPSREYMLNQFRDFFSFHNPANKGWKGIDEEFSKWYDASKSKGCANANGFAERSRAEKIFY